MAKKRKTLPKDFKELIEAGNLFDLQAVFDKCEFDATGGFMHGTALSFPRVPDDLVRWLIGNGLDINTRDAYGMTPLHQQCSFPYSNIDVFLELGADIEGVDLNGNRPLHFAADRSSKTVHALIKKGADATAKNNSGQTPLEAAVSRTQNTGIAELSLTAKMLLDAGDIVTKTMQNNIIRLGENFEFYRDVFDKKLLPATDAGLSSLYEMFNVTPVKRKVTHDGVSPITVTGTTWKEQYNELWEFLIPGKGEALTVQGEVIRINGRITDEKFRNGGCNWDDDYRKMLDALVRHLGTGVPLDKSSLDEATVIAKAARVADFDDKDKLYRLCELTVKWVLLNPNPIKLEKPEYKR